METAMAGEYGVATNERRKANRYNLSLPVTIDAAGRPSRSARSRDVSTGGIYVVVANDDTLLPGTELTLTVILPRVQAAEEEVQVRARGRAVRIDKPSDGEDQTMGLAVIFETHDLVRFRPNPS